MLPVPQTPHALYRAMFFYIVTAFGIGWFLPVNGVLWGILLATALVLYLRIRSLARGEKRLYDRFPAGKSGISSLQWLYLLIAVTGMVVAFYGGTAASYGELREARGIVPAKPYRIKKAPNVMPGRKLYPKTDSPDSYSAARAAM